MNLAVKVIKLMLKLNNIFPVVPQFIERIKKIILKININQTLVTNKQVKKKNCLFKPCNGLLTHKRE